MHPHGLCVIRLSLDPTKDDRSFTLLSEYVQYVLLPIEVTTVVSGTNRTEYCHHIWM